MHGLATEVAGEGGAVAAGPLHTDLVELPKREQPSVELPVAGEGGRERLGAQDPPELVERRGDVQVLMGVNAARDDQVGECEGGHVRPSG